MKTLIFIIFFSLTELSFGIKIPRIGIVGGGIGGTSCAYFLKSLFSSNVVIDIFEAEKVGGRLSLVNFSNNLYEEGGSIIHSRNKYMVEFLNEFKLRKRQTPNGYFALYDGHNFVFSESEWQLRTLWNVIYRYGLGFWKLRSYIDDMLTKFDRIYDLQKAGETYDTVQSMLAAIDPNFVNYLFITTKHGFRSQEISSLIINEIIMATIRANYGQNVNIPKMVGSVSVAGAIGTLWAVDKGNVQIPENLLKASGANLINLVVTSITKDLNGKFHISAAFKDKPNEDHLEKIYDVVILAAPQTVDAKYKIDFKNFTNNIEFVGKYHKTVCTLIEGNLSDVYFPKKSPLIDEILTTKDEVVFNSVGRITPVDYNPEKHSKSDVWKIFTQEKMDEKEIFSLFSSVKNKYVREWLAYPHYETTFRNDSFVLAPNLYYINAIEWAASAMEMSVIGAKNVALLAYKNFLSAKGRSNEIHFPKEGKSSTEQKEEL